MVACGCETRRPNLVSHRDVAGAKASNNPFVMSGIIRTGSCFSTVATLMSKLLALISVLWACCTAAAATLQQLNLDQMTQSATAIVRARVTGSSASFTGSTIYTHYKLQTTETWKGFAASEVMIPGGVAGGYRQTFPGMPVLQTGTEYVLFLWTSSTGITHLVGLSQGIFNVSQLSDGTVQVGRAAIGENIFDAAGHTVKDQAVHMQLSEMRSRVNTSGAVGATR